MAGRCVGGRVVAPVGDRDGYTDLYSGKKHLPGQNIQVVADLDGLVADVGDPVPGARHDAAAFWLSGIAKRWHSPYQPGGMGMTGDMATSAAGSSPLSVSRPAAN